MVESCGGKFFDQDGKEKDLFVLLKEGGFTSTRIRIWVDPYNGNHEPYLGGSNDLETALTLAKRAKKAGLSTMLDFHYSDFFADPAKQHKPKAWASLNGKALEQKVYSYTKESLLAFKDAGIEVAAAQIGNEINNGCCAIQATSETFGDLSSFLKQGISALKEVYPNAKSFLHLTDLPNQAGVSWFLESLKQNAVSYDCLGFSYYPYWHDGIEEAQTFLSSLVSQYQKDIYLVETAYGYTDEPHADCWNQFSSSGFGEKAGYPTSPAGQKQMLQAEYEMLQSLGEHGKGIFYWEPAWLPVKGANWASPSGAYYGDHGQDASSSEELSPYSERSLLNSWANQALFDYNGKALDSLYAPKEILLAPDLGR